MESPTSPVPNNESRGRLLPGPAWLMVGLAVAVLVIPTTAGAVALLKYTGIQSASGNKANVSGAGQLQTVEAPPTEFAAYRATVSSLGGYACTAEVTVPAGFAYVLRQANFDFVDVTSPGSTPSGTESRSGVVLVANMPGQACTSGAIITSAEAPGGNVGNVVMPISPGYVIPAGYSLSAYSYQGAIAGIYVNGYLVPAADAPTVPQ